MPATTGYALYVDAIDWGTAQRVGELIAGSPPYGGVRAEGVEPMVLEFAGRVGVYSGLTVPSELPPLEVVDRPTWIAANLDSMRPLLAPLTERIAAEEDEGFLPGSLRGPLRAASGHALGAQVGALTGVLSQRVLGQYDLALLDASVTPRLLLLGPNLAQAAGNLGIDRDELVLWVTIHEITHAVQFSGAPWLREYLGGIVEELIEGMRVMVGGGDGGEGDGEAGRSASPGDVLRGLAGKVPSQDELREMVGRVRGGQLLRLTLGEDRWALVERMQAAMSLIEGHAEHTMDVIGEDFLPSLPRLRAAMNRRRSQKGLPWKVLERLLGLELKMRQYEAGRGFCDAVVEAGGPQALALAWRGPDSLPTAAEIEQPALWVARVGGGGGESPDLQARTHVPHVTN